MVVLYRWFLYLYPADHRSLFGAEMTGVFRQAQAAVQEQGAAARVTFCLRELLGLVRGAVVEQARTLGYGPLSSVSEERSFPMRSQFRFSSTAIFFMIMTLAAIVFAIMKAQTIVLHEAGLASNVYSIVGRLPRGILLFFVMSCVAGVIGWLVAFAIRRSGVHRLSKSETSPPHS